MNDIANFLTVIILKGLQVILFLFGIVVFISGFFA